jgi:hypothetical protein
VKTDERNIHVRNVGVENQMRVQDPIFPGLFPEIQNDDVLGLARRKDDSLEGAETEKFGSRRSEGYAMHSHLD